MNERRVLRIVFGVLIAGAVGWGLWLSGGPGHNRLLREDGARREGMRQAASMVEEHFRREGVLPASLEAARKSCAETPSVWCPEFTPADYAYRPLDEAERFEICADFALAAPRGEEPPHPAGRFCQNYKVSTGTES